MLEELKAKLAEFIAEELDEAIPDGTLQALAGEAVRLVGEALVEAGEDISGELNNDE